MSTFLSNSNPATWQEAVKQLDEAKRQFNKLHGIMTPLEIKFVRQELSEAREKYRQAIENGVIGEHAAAIENFKAKLARVEEEKRAVTNSWNAAELGAQMQVYQKLVENAAGNADLGSLQTIYQEAKDSGDKYKIRAAAVAIQSASARTPAGAQDTHGEDIRRAVNLMRKQATRDLEALTNSPDLETAHQAAAEAVEVLNQAKRQIVSAAEAMDEVAPNGNVNNTNLGHALARVTQDESGNLVIKDAIQPIPPQPARKMTETEKSFYQIKE